MCGDGYSMAITLDQGSTTKTRKLGVMNIQITFCNSNLYKVSNYNFQGHMNSYEENKTVVIQNIWLLYACRMIILFYYRNTVALALQR